MHKLTLERLLRLGVLMSLAAQHPDFPDRKLAEAIAATQQTLRDKLAMWHGPPLSPLERERTLAACFPE